MNKLFSFDFPRRWNNLLIRNIQSPERRIFWLDIVFALGRSKLIQTKYSFSNYHLSYGLSNIFFLNGERRQGKGILTQITADTETCSNWINLLSQMSWQAVCSTLHGAPRSRQCYAPRMVSSCRAVSNHIVNSSFLLFARFSSYFFLFSHSSVFDYPSFSFLPSGGVGDFEKERKMRNNS